MSAFAPAIRHCVGLTVTPDQLIVFAEESTNAARIDFCHVHECCTIQGAVRLAEKIGSPGGQILQTLRLDGALSVSGTQETGGALTIGDQSSLAPIGSIQVNHGGSFTGESCFIFGDLIINGGSLWGGDDDFDDWDVSGDVTIEEGVALELNIGGPAPEDHDVVNVGGAARVRGEWY
jgi:hypothetical protein